MTFDECLQLVHSQNLPAVCIGEPTSVLKTIEALAVIGSSVAVVLAALFAWQQLKSLKTQILEDRNSVFAQIKSSSDNERLASTLDLLIRMSTNQHWLENRQLFVGLRDTKEGLKKHAGENSKEALAIRAMLNQYELIAVGIGNGILDEKMFRTYYRGTVVKDWLASVQFIDEERKENDRYWIELQHLAERFQGQN